MGTLELQLLESLAVGILAVVIILASNSSVARVAVKYNFQKERVAFTKKIIKILVFCISLVVLLFIWGVDQRQLVLYLSSFIAVVGIALFAQWSVLSNVTASILLFTSHPARIGDTIIIQDKEIDLTGKVVDIGMFFTSLHTPAGEVVTIPNTMFFQKMVKIIAE